MASAPIELIKVPRSTDLAWPDLWPEEIGLVLVEPKGKIAYFDPREDDGSIKRRVDKVFGQSAKIRTLDHDEADFIDISCRVEDILRGNNQRLEEAEDFEVEIDFLLSEGLPTADAVPAEAEPLKPALVLTDVVLSQPEMNTPTLDEPAAVVEETVMKDISFAALVSHVQAEAPEAPEAHPQSAELGAEAWLSAGQENPRSFMSWGKVEAHGEYLVFISDLVKRTSKSPLSDAAIMTSEDLCVNASGLSVRGPAAAARPSIAIPVSTLVAKIEADSHLEGHLAMDLEHFYLTITSGPKIPVATVSEQKKPAKRWVLPYLVIALVTLMGIAGVAASGFSGGKSSGGDKAESAVGSIRDGLFGG